MIESYKSLVQPFIDNTQLTINQLEEEQIAFNINLNKKRFYKISSFVVYFGQEYKFALSSLITLFEDLDGNTFNDLSDSARLKFLFINIFPQNDLTYIIFSYYTKDKNHYEEFKNKILSLTETEQKIIITKIIAKYIENFFISPSKWDCLSNDTKETFLNCSFDASLFGTTIQEFSNINIFV